MLKKPYRLKKRKTFNYIYRKGRSTGNSELTLVYCFARGRNVKIGFSVSKKIGNSPQRHRATRVMREAIKPLIESMAVNHYYIFVAKEGMHLKKSTQIQGSMEQVLKKAGLFHAVKTPSVQRGTNNDKSH